MFLSCSAGTRPFPPASPTLCLSQSCMSFLHRVSFRSRRRRLACGAALFRAYRMCARARVCAGAVRAPDCARAKRRAHVSRPFRWGFFAPVRGKRTKRHPDAASSCLILPRFCRGQALTGNYFIIRERIAAADRGPDAPVRAQFDPDESTGDGRIAAGLVSRSSPRTAIRGPAPTVFSLAGRPEDGPRLSASLRPG